MDGISAGAIIPLILGVHPYMPEHNASLAGAPLVRPTVPTCTANAAPGGIVMVVDDDDLVREVAGLMLQRAGYRVLKAEGGREAVEIMRRAGQAVDCAVVDVMMPGVDGPTALAEMRKIRPDLPAVMFSGFADDRLAARGAQAASRFLRKPFTTTELVAAVRGALGR